MAQVFNGVGPLPKTVFYSRSGKLQYVHVGQYRDEVQGMGRGFHDVALYQVPHGLPADYRQRAGLNHLALRLRTPAEVDAAAEFLRAMTHQRNLKRPSR